MPTLCELPNGTILQRRNNIFCLQHGLDGRILVDVETGVWTFLREIENTSAGCTFKILFVPNEDRRAAASKKAA